MKSVLALSALNKKQSLQTGVVLQHLDLMCPVLQKKSLWEKFLDLWEPHVSRQTLINEGVIFLIFDLW